MTALKVQHPAWSREVFVPKTVNGQPVRYRVALGGRGSSKSWEFSRRLLIRAATEQLTILCTRELQKSIRDSVHRLLVNQIDQLGLGAYFETNKTQVASHTGSEFLFDGLRHNADEIKSTEGIDICWIEEGQKTSQDSLDDVLPTIRKPGSEIWCTYNPKHATDPIHRMFVTEGRDNAIVRHVNWNENPWFPEVLRVEMEQLRASNPKLARRVWDGEIVDVGSGDYFPADKVTIIEQAPAGLRNVVRAWDLAATEPSHTNPDPDWTSGVKMVIDPAGRVIILDVERGQLNANKVRNLVRQTAERDGREILCRMPVDPGQAGKEQAESYRRMLAGYRFKSERVTGDKETRAEPLSAAWQNGNVYMVRGAWNEPVLRVMNAFPEKGEHDDDVDAASDAYAELTSRSTYTLANVG